MGLRKFLTPKIINKYTDEYRKNGFKGILKKGGLAFLIGFILFYLIRDSILYIIIPYLVAKGVIDIF